MGTVLFFEIIQFSAEKNTSVGNFFMDGSRAPGGAPPQLPIENCVCARSESISVYFDEIATYLVGARDDRDRGFLMAILGVPQLIAIRSSE